MAANSQQPKAYDAVLRRQPVTHINMIDLLIEVLQKNDSENIKYQVYLFLKTIASKIKQVLQNYNHYELFECLHTLEGHSNSVNSVAITPDSTKIVSGSWDYTIKIWDLATRECLRTLTDHLNYISSVDHLDSVNTVTITPDSTKIISGSRDKTIKIWNLATGECLRTLEGHSDSVNSVAITHDGKKIVSGSWDNTLKIWGIPED